jgi:DNA-binding response OmpR family regulator
MIDTPAPLRAAVVDDDRLTRLLVRRTLEAAGYAVEEADSGAAGLRLAQQRPDVMILDLQLPDMSGLAVCRAVTRDVPVVFLTATDDAHVTDQCYRSGAMDCVQKPIAPVELSERVGTAIKLRAENSPPRGWRPAPA